MPKNEETALDKYPVFPFSDNALKLSKSLKQWCKDISLARIIFLLNTHAARGCKEFMRKAEISKGFIWIYHELCHMITFDLRKTGSLGFMTIRRL